MKTFKMGNVNIIATRDPHTCTYLKWKLCEATTGLSIMPSPWPQGYSADTLANAMNLVQKFTIDKYGEAEIQRRVDDYVRKRNNEP